MSNINRESIRYALDEWLDSIQLSRSNALALNFIKKLSVDGGIIVLASECNPVEVEVSKENDRYFEDDKGCAYIIRIEY
jgi:hypothetical protein